MTDLFKPTYIRVGTPHNTVRPPTLIRPPTEPGQATLTETSTYVSEDNNNTDHSILFPSYVAGDGMILGINWHSEGTPVATPSGWTPLLDGFSWTGVGGEMSVYYRKMDGTEGASVSWTLSADDETSAVLMRFRGRDFATDPPEASGGSAVNSDTFDPPSVTPSSSGEYIVLTMTSYFLGTSATPPAGYGQVVLTDATRSNPQSGWFVTKAFKTITTSEDPGTGTFNDTGRLGTVTVAVLLTDKSAPVATGDHTHAVAQSLAFSKTGTLEVTTGASKFPALFDMTLIGVRAAVGTAPTGADLIVDVNLNGTTVYTTQGNRPTISDGSTSSTETVPDVTAVAAGDLLSVDIDQVGSSTAGSDLVVAIEFQEA